MTADMHNVPTCRWPSALLYAAVGVHTETTRRACAGRARLRLVGSTASESPDRAFFGLGLYRSYLTHLPRFLDNISCYYPALAKGTLILVLADQLQRYNLPQAPPTRSKERRKRRRFLRDRQRIADQLEALIDHAQQTRPVGQIELHRWDVLAADSRYQSILARVLELYARDPTFRDAMRSTTASKLRLCACDETIDWRAGYALEEVASILFYHERGVAKITHSGEEGYDAATIDLVMRRSDELALAHRRPLKLIDVDQPAGTGRAAERSSTAG
jgi:hypothetical protein